MESAEILWMLKLESIVIAKLAANSLVAVILNCNAIVQDEGTSQRSSNLNNSGIGHCFIAYNLTCEAERWRKFVRITSK